VLRGIGARHSHLPGSRLAALGYPPPPGLRACSSSACINANAIERDGRVCNKTIVNMRLRSPPAQRMSQGWHQRSRRARCCPAPTRAATADAVRCCSAALAWPAAHRSELESESECGELAALRALEHAPARTAICSACSTCAFIAPTAARAGRTWQSTAAGESEQR
jgi:hypothetical protein